MLSLHGGKRPHDNHAGNLGITVLRDVRGCGIGRQLMLAAIARAKAWDDFCRIELDVVSWNPIKEALKQKAVNYRGKPEAEYQMALVW
jgi:GNAT superfamily N-acetyltransferase